MDFATPEGNGVLVLVDLDVYGTLPLLKAAYVFTDRCFLHLQHRDAEHVEVRFHRKTEALSLQQIVGEFMNELLDQRVRCKIAEETEPLRNLILAHALSRTSLIEAELETIDPVSDPLGIGSPDTSHHA